MMAFLGPVTTLCVLAVRTNGLVGAPTRWRGAVWRTVGSVWTQRRQISCAARFSSLRCAADDSGEWEERGERTLIAETAGWSGSRIIHKEEGDTSLSAISDRVPGLQLAGFHGIIMQPEDAAPGLHATDAGAASDTSAEGSGAAPNGLNVRPLRVMIFVDGTWLYYSFFGRGKRCPIPEMYGPRWSQKYRPQWDVLPALIASCVREQMKTYMQADRFVEVSRTVVFSSARADTPADSERMQMFKAMQQHNFEVHMATTKGVQEKCIDIALAVEMLHYATIPEAYDIAVLVTGDKDFMPAMSRTRQKGKRVCLASMRNSCNLSLMDPAAHIRDLDIIWLDDHLGEILKYEPRGLPMGDDEVGGEGTGGPSAELLCQVVSGIVERHGGVMGSRNLGRDLQCLAVDGQNSLTLIKQHYSSLRRFLELYENVYELRAGPDGPSGGEFLVLLRDEENSIMSAKLGGSDDTNVGVASTAGVTGPALGKAAELAGEAATGGLPTAEAVPPPREAEEIAADLSRHTVPEVKDLLRRRRLPLQGTKAVLVARLVDAVAAEEVATAAAAVAAAGAAATAATAAGSGDGAADADAEGEDVEEGANGGDGGAIGAINGASAINSAGGYEGDRFGLGGLLDSPRVTVLQPLLPIGTPTWAPSPVAPPPAPAPAPGGSAWMGASPPPFSMSAGGASSGGGGFGGVGGRLPVGAGGGGPAMGAVSAAADEMKLTTCIEAFLRQRSGGEASSRDVGRCLAAQVWDGRSSGPQNALQYLKHTHGSLKSYLSSHPGKFRLIKPVPADSRGERVDYTVQLIGVAGGEY
ncbi:unnamed protein product [Phaeothamnion confervicola]